MWFSASPALTRLLVRISRVRSLRGRRTARRPRPLWPRRDPQATGALPPLVARLLLLLVLLLAAGWRILPLVRVAAALLLRRVAACLLLRVGVAAGRLRVGVAALRLRIGVAAGRRVAAAGTLLSTEGVYNRNMGRGNSREGEGVSVQ
jgi:hypothetical protein